MTSADSFGFHGKVVLITGAATGIGRAVAIEFANHGAQLAIGDVNEEAARETLELVKFAGSEAIFVRTDVSQEADVQRLVRDCFARDAVQLLTVQSVLSRRKNWWTVRALRNPRTQVKPQTRVPPPTSRSFVTLRRRRLTCEE